MPYDNKPMPGKMGMDDAEGAADPDASAEASEPMSASIEASIEALGGAKVGDSVSLTVESIDEKTGTATLVPSTSSQPKTGSSIERAASEIEGA